MGQDRFSASQTSFEKIYKKIDYSEYGGAHLLGVNGICIIGHGRSNQKAVKNAIRIGKDIVLEKLQDRIKEELARYTVLQGEVRP